MQKSSKASRSNSINRQLVTQGNASNKISGDAGITSITTSNFGIVNDLKLSDLWLPYTQYKMWDVKQKKKFINTINILYQNLCKLNPEFKSLTFDRDISLEIFVKNIYNTIQSQCTADKSMIVDQNDEFLIVEYTEVPIKNYDSGQMMDIEFIRRCNDKNLRNALYCTVSYIANKTSCNYIDRNDSMHYDYAMETLMQELENDSEKKEEIEMWLNTHGIKGELFLFSNAINKLNPSAKQLETIAKKIKKTYPVIYQWIVKAIKIGEQNNTVYDFDLNPDDYFNDNGAPLMYSDTIGFFWHPDDILFQIFSDYVQCSANEVGETAPYCYGLYGIDRFKKYEYTTWANDLYEWFQKGNHLLSKLQTTSKSWTTLEHNSNPKELLPTINQIREVNTLKSIL